MVQIDNGISLSHKKNEIMPFAATWMDLEMITPSEVRQRETNIVLLMEKVKVLVPQSCPTLCNPMSCSPPGSSVHGTLQTRILERVANSFSRGSSRPRD